VEKKGILKGRQIARGADGLLIVLDGSRRESPEDARLIKQFRSKKAIFVVNKADLPGKIDMNKVRLLSAGAPLVKVSALKGTDLPRLREEIRRTFAPEQAPSEEVILHLRQRDVLADILDALKEARRLLAAGHGDELYAEEIRKAISLIGRLTGEIQADEVMNDIFSRFCVGK
jgi:tRNA modification GTPase